MYAVELDESKRLLVISAAGRVTAEHVRAAAKRVGKLLQHVGPGFCVLADFRLLDSMDSAAARHIAEIMDALTEKGIASVARVVPDPHKDIGLNILSQFPLWTGDSNQDLRDIGRCAAKRRSEIEFDVGLMFACPRFSFLV